MEDDKIKIGDIEGNKDVVLDFIKASGADVPSLLNVPREIKIPFWGIVVSSVLFTSIVIILAIFELDESIYKALSLLSIAIAFLLIALVYMAYRNKVLTGIVAFGEVVLLSVSLGIYSPKEVIEKIGHRMEDVINK